MSSWASGTFCAIAPPPAPFLGFEEVEE